MIRQDIYIKDKWHVIIYYNVEGNIDEGKTITYYNKHLSIVYINESSSIEEFFNTLIHELNHVQSNYCTYFRIPEESETASYLIGYLAMESIRFIKNKIFYKKIW